MTIMDIVHLSILAILVINSVMVYRHIKSSHFTTKSILESLKIDLGKIYSKLISHNSNTQQK